MDVIRKLVSQPELRPLLRTYFTNFGIQEIDSQFLISSRYETLVREGALWSLQMWEKQELIGSAVACERVLMHTATPIRICFFSQIWIENKHRKKGHLNLLMNELDITARNINSDASMVIARKNVGDLYAKYGFEGISKFPVVKFPSNELVGSSLQTKAFLKQDIQGAYESTYGNQDVFFFRSRDYWNTILKCMQNSSVMKFYTYEIDETLVYLIMDSDEVVEIATIDNTRWRAIVRFLVLSGMHIYKLDDKHPAYQEMLLQNASYSVRPEPREGHMIKIYQTVSPNKQDREKVRKLQSIVSEMNLNILPLDQW